MKEEFLKILNKYANTEINDKNINESINNLGIDSMDTIELLLDLEDTLSIRFPDEWLTGEKFSTPENIYRLVRILKDEERNN